MCVNSPVLSCSMPTITSYDWDWEDFVKMLPREGLNEVPTETEEDLFRLANDLYVNLQESWHLHVETDEGCMQEDCMCRHALLGITRLSEEAELVHTQSICHHYLFRMYRDGLGVTRSIEKAREHLDKAGELRNVANKNPVEKRVVLPDIAELIRLAGPVPERGAK